MALAAIDQRAIVGVAFAEIEFAADHVVASFGIAVDLDALDIEPLALFDRVDKVDQPADRAGARSPATTLANGWPVFASAIVRSSTVLSTASAS